MPGNLAFDDFDFLIPTAPASFQNDPNLELRQQTKKKRLRISELIADNDELVRQLKQLQDFQRTASEVSELYQSEKQQRIELECRTQELDDRCNELEKQLDVQQLNCDQLQEELEAKNLPVNAKHMVSVFMQLAQRAGENSNASGLLRREQNLLAKLKDYCKSAKISIPTPKSPTKKTTKSTAAAPFATQATQTNEPMPRQPLMCSTGVQHESLLTTRDQGTQHKNMTTTRGTTTASFIKKHDVGTCFPEPKPPLTAHQILNKMLAWNTATTPITPLSPISDPEPEVQLQSVGTCTDLCNIHREIDFLSELPTVLKRSNSRPPSRTMFDSVKDELAFPAGYGQHMAKELLNFLPHNQSVLTNLPPHVFEEVWQVMGQMVLVVLQRRSANPASSSTINQADFSSWFDAIYENSLSAHTKESVVSTQVEGTSRIDVGTDPITTMLPPVELTPIRLPRKPISKLRSKPKKLKRRTQPKPEESSDTAVKILSNFDVLINSKENGVSTQVEKTACIDVGTDPLLPPEIGVELSPIKLPRPKPKKLKRCAHSKPEEFTETAVNFLSNFNASINPKENGISTQAEKTTHIGTDSITTPLPPEIVVKPTPILLPQKPELRCEPKKLKRRSQTQPEESTETAVNLLSNFDVFNNSKENGASTQVEETPHIHVDTASITTMLPPKITVERTPVRLPRDKPKKLKRLAQSKSDDSTETAVNVVSNLDALIKENDVSTQVEGTPHIHVGTDPIKPLLLHETALEPTSIPLPQKLVSVVGSKLKKLKRRAQSKPKQPTETAVNFLSNLDIFINPNCDNLNIQLNAEEQQFLQLTSAAVCTQQFPAPAESCEKETEMAAEQVHSFNSLFGSDVESEIEAASEKLDKPIGQANNVEIRDPNDSDDSCKLVIDVEETVEVQSSNVSEELPSTSTPSPTAELLPEPLPLGKRKRKTSKCDVQPAVKRFTRLQAKQMEQLEQLELQDTETKAAKENNESNKKTLELQSSCIDSCSPASPEMSEQHCEDSEIMEIPLESPGARCSSWQPKPILNHVVTGIRFEAKQRGWRKQQPSSTQLEQLQQKVVNYFEDLVPLNPATRKYFKTHENDLSNALIKPFEDLELNAEHLERLFSVLNLFEGSSCAFTERLMSSLEQRLFRSKERLGQVEAQRFVRLYLELTKHRAGLAQTAEDYANPARLLLAKILYHYSKDLVLLLTDVLNFYPTVLPHREQRAYDNSDALITVIKHLLMCHKYEVDDPNGLDRALISKLRFVYHFKPYEPTRQQVIENLVEKLKAGHLENLSYAFALFCRRSEGANLVKDLLEVHLLPLLSSYCDLCQQSEMYDERMECLLQCVSMIVKQLPLDKTKDISVYIALFKRVLVAVPRPTVQQAAVQAILRTQRFGYGFVLEALNGYRPSYQLTAMTRAMLRSFAVRRQKLKLPN